MSPGSGWQENHFLSAEGLRAAACGGAHRKEFCRPLKLASALRALVTAEAVTCLPANPRLTPGTAYSVARSARSGKTPVPFDRLRAAVDLTGGPRLRNSRCPAVCKDFRFTLFLNP